MAETFGGSVFQAARILTADANVDAGARYKLPVWLRDEVQTSAVAAGNLNSAQGLTEGSRREDSIEVITAYEQGEVLIRNVSKMLNSLDARAQVPAMRAFYGLGPKLPINFRHEKIVEQLTDFQTAQNAPLVPEARLSAERLALIAGVLNTISTQSEGANIGGRSEITGDKREATDALNEAIDRVHYFLYSSLPKMFKDPLLHLYGFVPRQERESERDESPTQNGGEIE